MPTTAFSEDDLDKTMQIMCYYQQVVLAQLNAKVNTCFEKLQWHIQYSVNHLRWSFFGKIVTMRHSGVFIINFEYISPFFKYFYC